VSLFKAHHTTHNIPNAVWQVLETVFALATPQNIDLDNNNKIVI